MCAIAFQHFSLRDVPRRSTILSTHLEWAKHFGAKAPLFIIAVVCVQVAKWCKGDRDGLPHISTWDTSEITDMEELFKGKGALFC